MKDYRKIFQSRKTWTFRNSFISNNEIIPITSEVLTLQQVIYDQQFMIILLVAAIQFILSSSLHIELGRLWFQFTFAEGIVRQGNLHEGRVFQHLRIGRESKQRGSWNNSALLDGTLLHVEAESYNYFSSSLKTIFFGFHLHFLFFSAVEAIGLRNNIAAWLQRAWYRVGSNDQRSARISCLLAWTERKIHRTRNSINW